MEYRNPHQQRRWSQDEVEAGLTVLIERWVSQSSVVEGTPSELFQRLGEDSELREQIGSPAWLGRCLSRLALEDARIEYARSACRRYWRISL